MKSTFWIASLLLCSIAAAQVTPAAQQPPPPPAEPEAPAQPQPAEAKPPAAAKPAAPPRENIEDMLSVSLYYWAPKGQPGFRAGDSVADPTTGELDLTKNADRGQGFQITFPTGGFNRLEIGYWRIYDAGDVIAQHKLSIFGANVAKGERLNTQYKLSNLRVAWNYLTFPVPPFDSKLRVKTFWEVQWTQMSPTIGFPEARNNPSPINPKQNVFYPGVGAGLEYVFSKHFRLEGRGSGMAWPGRSGYWDVEGSAIARISHVEVFGTYKGFHFHTSPHSDETYEKGTFWGPAFGLRWVFR